MKDSCEICPNGSDGQPSKLYKELNKKLDANNRQITNLMYAISILPNFINEMKAKGYSLNSLGELPFNAVWKELHGDDFLNPSNKLNNAIRFVNSRESGTSTGKLIIYDDVNEAIENARRLNDNPDYNKLFVASVVLNGDGFSISLETRNANNHLKAEILELNVQIWDLVSSKLKEKKFAVDKLEGNSAAYANPIRMYDFVSYMKRLKRLTYDNLTVNDIAFLLQINLDKYATQINRLSENGLKSFEEVAQEIYDALHGEPVSGATLGLMKITLGNCKKFDGVDFEELKTEINKYKTNFATNSEEFSVKDTLTRLYRDYHIDVKNVLEWHNDITSLADATIHSMVALQNKLRDLLEMTVNTTAEQARIKKLIAKLEQEIANKTYKNGALQMMASLTDEIYSCMSDHNTINPDVSSDEAKIKAMATLSLRMKGIIDSYSDIIKSYTLIDQLISEENISTRDKEEIQQQAIQLLKYIDKLKEVLKDLSKITMHAVIELYTADSPEMHDALIGTMDVARNDSTFQDRLLYSATRGSDDLASFINSRVRACKDARNEKLAAISVRIKRIHSRLGSADTSFMYTDDGNIISNIDYEKYNKELELATAQFMSAGMRGIQLDNAIENWEKEHTSEQTVGNSNKTQRLPDGRYLKRNKDGSLPLDNLTERQLEYYNEMLAIKQELEELIPEDQRNLFLAPLRRQSFAEMWENVKFYNLYGKWKAIKRYLSDISTLQEDEEGYGVEVGGVESTITKVDMAGRVRRKIPIFYHTKLKDQSRLSKDFTGGMLALASSTINYSTLSEHLNEILAMEDFILHYRDYGDTSFGKRMVDKVAFGRYSLFRMAKKDPSAVVSGTVVSNYIDAMVFNNMNKNDYFSPKVSKRLGLIIAYTSIKGLAVNLKGALANWTIGKLQQLIDAGSGEFFNFKDFAWAELVAGGEILGAIADNYTNLPSHKALTFAEYFDLFQDINDTTKDTYFAKSNIGRLMSNTSILTGYSAGEYGLRLTTMLAMMHHIKVVGPEGNVMLGRKNKPTLFDALALEVKDGVAEVKIKPGYTLEDGTEITEEYLQDFKRQLRLANHSMQGAMNAEEKGFIHGYLIGRAVMNFKLWMVEHFSRRFRMLYRDATTKKLRQGYYVSILDIYGMSFKENYERIKAQNPEASDDEVSIYAGFQAFLKASWQGTARAITLARGINIRTEVDEMHRRNVRRFITEQFIITMLYIMDAMLGEAPDDDDDTAMRYFMYLIKRGIMEESASDPLTAYNFLSNLVKTIREPIASARSIDLMLLLLKVTDLTKENKSHKEAPIEIFNRNKYMHNLYFKVLPFTNDIYGITHFRTENTAFNIFTMPAFN